MSKVIAVFGAGTGLGVSVARRFGREGFRVALVARRRERLDALVAELAADGIEAAAFTADLGDSAAVPSVVAGIRERFGRIDVVEYAPVGGDMRFTPATELSGDTLRPLLDLYVLTPVEVIRAVLPELTERGDGAILVTQGGTAAEPAPYLSGVGPTMAATRNYLYSLGGELAGTGVHVGMLTIGAMIARSEAHEALTSGAFTIDLPEGVTVPVVDPDTLAELYWDMYIKRDRVEQFYPAPDGLPVTA